MEQDFLKQKANKQNVQNIFGNEQILGKRACTTSMIEKHSVGGRQSLT